ncbi:uncharacterized protein DS421_16g548700 [Arachis hypogaea]|nr:uncharacterized protein DS421_16g548700 [Arachis hypogaea]
MPSPAKGCRTSSSERLRKYLQGTPMLKLGRSISVSSVGSAGARKKKRFVASRCNCGIHAILFMSSTQSNPNRLFFGCPNFKTAESHCKYFLWLDEYVLLFEEEQINDDSLYGQNPKQNHLLDAAVSMEKKLTKLEDKVSSCICKLSPLNWIADS